MGENSAGGRTRSLCCPALSHGCQKLLLVLLHCQDKRLIFRFFVPGGPQNHFREHRRQIDSLARQQVNQLSPIRGVLFRGQDSVSDQLLQAIRQDVRRDSLVGTQELLVRSKSPQHHVAQNQQRPAISQRLHGSIQRTPRPALWCWRLFCHAFTIAYFHLHFASKMLQTDTTGAGIFLWDMKRIAGFAV